MVEVLDRFGKFSIKYYKTILVLMFTLISSFVTLSCNSFEISTQDTISGVFKVIEIIKDKNIYIIHLKNEATSEDRIYTLLSKKKTMSALFKKRIRIGKNYKMSLIPYFRRDVVANHNTAWTIKVDDIYVTIGSKGWRNNVYLTPNLKGLHYIRQ